VKAATIEAVRQERIQELRTDVIYAVARKGKAAESNVA
jgi:hypothetical protein